MHAYAMKRQRLRSRDMYHMEHFVSLIYGMLRAFRAHDGRLQVVLVLLIGWQMILY
jgi:hypothetical protein